MEPRDDNGGYDQDHRVLQGLGFRMWGSSGFRARFLSRPFIIWVPFFLILSFIKGTLKQKGQKGTTQEPRECHRLRDYDLLG